MASQLFVAVSYGQNGDGQPKATVSKVVGTHGEANDTLFKMLISDKSALRGHVISWSWAGGMKLVSDFDMDVSRDASNKSYYPKGCYEACMEAAAAAFSKAK